MSDCHAFDLDLDAAADEIERLRAEVERLRHYRDVVQRCVGADKEINRLRAEIERLREDGRFQSFRVADKDVEIERLRAEIERLRAAAVWHCEACGTVTRSGECDCTKLQTSTQRLVPYDYRACLDAEVERLREALRAMLNTHGKPHREEWMNDAGFEHAKAVDAQARRALGDTP